MAIRLTNGNYIKAVGYDYLRMVVHAIVFNDEAQRLRWPDNLTPFEHSVLQTAALPVDGLDAKADSKKSVKDNVLDACYAALKLDPRFAEGVDC